VRASNMPEKDDGKTGGNDLRVVIADDHRLFLLGLRQFLGKQPGIRVVGEAATGLEAVAAAAQHRPDILLLDISMPELNGIEAARRIHEETPDTRVIILSMYADRRYVTEALRAGARGYLLKSSAPGEVLRAIHKVAAGQFHLAEGIEQVVAEVVGSSGPSGDSAFTVLSSREREVLQLLAEGKSTKQIGDLLNVSVKTVETHRQHIMDKIGLRTVAELTRYAIREGLTPLE
jgi:two-component system, NarL family, response regulator NreC